MRRAAEASYEAGVRHLAAGAFTAADSALRGAARGCGTDEQEQAALLMLASLNLDPRNPSAHPDSAALMAARYLYMPDATPEGRLLAEGLYVQALDHGGDPGLRPGPGEPGSAGGETCLPSWRAAGAEPRSLPILTTMPYAMRLGQARNRLDSLDAVHGATRRRVAELEAELARIRSLLQLRDTLSSGAAPGR